MNSPSDFHEQKVQAIQQQVERFHEQHVQFRIFHGNTNTTRNNKIDRSKLVDISSLTEILEINTTDAYVVAEANVPMDALVDAVLAKGFIPLVVPEFPSITIGGAVQGGAGESSSFKYGCVHSVCLEYEILLANGSQITASALVNRDLYNSIAGSYGSIGIITAVKMRLMPAEPYIKLSYRSVSDYQSAVAAITEATLRSNDFVDGIQFSATKGVVMEGVFVNKALPNHSTLHKATDDWFYLHAERNIAKLAVYEETIPTKDYLFRYDRGAFWVARYGFKMFHIPFTRSTRFLFVRLFKTRTLYSFLDGAKLSQGYIIQDICLPQENAAAFMAYNDEQFQIFPLWLCPLKLDQNEYLSPTYLKSHQVINVGIWGKLEADYVKFVEKNRELEAKVASLGGRKVLYAHAYYTEAEFWKLYDLKTYQAVRKTYGAATGFPDVYTKTHVAERYHSSIGKGVLKMLKAAVGK